jgi:hypothetical protein
MRPFLAVAVAFVFGIAVIADEPRADEVKKKGGVPFRLPA